MSEVISFFEKAQLVNVIFAYAIIIFMLLSVLLPKNMVEQNNEFIYISTIFITAILGVLVSAILFSLELVGKFLIISKVSYNIFNYINIFLLIISGIYCIEKAKDNILSNRLVKFILMSIMFFPVLIHVSKWNSGGIVVFLENLSYYQFNIDENDLASIYRNSTTNFNNEKDNYDGILDNIAIFIFISVITLSHFQYFIDKIRILIKLRKQHIIDVNFNTDSINVFIMFLAVSISILIALIASGAGIFQIGIFSGVLAAGFTIAFRELLNNIVAGLILYSDKSFRSGHVVELQDGWVGVVKDFHLRYTRLEDRNKIEILVPNGKLISEPIINYTRDVSLIRLGVDIALPLGIDVKLIEAFLINAALECSRVVKNLKNSPKIFHKGHSYWATHIELKFWINSPGQGIENIKSDVMNKVMVTLSALKITVPTHHITIDEYKKKISPIDKNSEHSTK